MDQLPGRQIVVRADQPLDASVPAVVRATAPDGRSLLLEFVQPLHVGADVFAFAVASPRLARDDLGTLLRTGTLACALTCVPRDRHDPAHPFDLSWWRGGAAAIADLVL